MTTVLVGGGWDYPSRTFGPFLAAAGSDPRIACVVLDEGDGEAQFERWRDTLTAVAACRPQPVLITPGSTLDASVLFRADAMLVAGGHTPGYATALAPVAGAVQKWLGARRPYAGFSAGAAVAARDAVVGGFAVDGRQVCPDEAGEDLDEVTVRPGLGLTGFAVDVHASAWGTLGRLVAAVSGGLVPAGVAIDDDTALVLDRGTARVAGVGAVHVVTRQDAGALVRSHLAGADVSRELGKWSRR